MVANNEHTFSAFYMLDTVVSGYIIAFNLPDIYMMQVLPVHFTYEPTEVLTT